MMRLIARVDIRNGNHIKTINCEGVKILRPIETSIFQFTEVEPHDEIVIIDTVASLYGNTNWLIRQKHDFFYTNIPLAVGGGINSVDSAIETLNRGADKIILNTAAIIRPSLINEISSVCGRQAVVLQIDAKKINGEYMCFTHGARELSNYSVLAWLKLAQQRGVGEIHLTSIDTEGTDILFPQDLVELVSSNTSLPIILSGGILSADQISMLIKNHKIYAFSISSITNRLLKPLTILRKELTDLGEQTRCP